MEQIPIVEMGQSGHMAELCQIPITLDPLPAPNDTKPAIWTSDNTIPWGPLTPLQASWYSKHCPTLNLQINEFDMPEVVIDRGSGVKVIDKCICQQLMSWMACPFHLHMLDRRPVKPLSLVQDLIIHAGSYPFNILEVLLHLTNTLVSQAVFGPHQAVFPTTHWPHQAVYTNVLSCSCNDMQYLDPHFYQHKLQLKTDVIPVKTPISPES